MVASSKRQSALWARIIAGITDLIINVLGVVFGAVLAYFLTKESGISSWVVALAVAAYLCILVIALALRGARQLELQEAREAEREARRQAESSTRQTNELKVQWRQEEREESVDLANMAISSTTRVLRIFSEQLQLVSATHGVLRLNDTEVMSLKSRLLEEIFYNLRMVFDSDKRGIDTTTYPHNFYKVALYEPDNLEHPSVLKRTFYDYPEGLSPGEGSDTFVLAENHDHARAAVVIAFKKQSIEVLEDIPEEAKKGARARWVNCRQGHAEEYASMACAAIVSGKKGQPARHCLGVVVVDTNKKRYFQETREFQAFLGNILNPFRTLLTITLELSRLSSQGDKTPQAGPAAA